MRETEWNEKWIFAEIEKKKIFLHGLSFENQYFVDR